MRTHPPTSSLSISLLGGGGGPKSNFHSFSSVLAGFFVGLLAPDHSLAATDIFGGPSKLQNLRTELGTKPGNSSFTYTTKERLRFTEEDRKRETDFRMKLFYCHVFRYEVRNG